MIYALVTSDDKTKFEEEINSNIKAGFVLTGSIIVTLYSYIGAYDKRNYTAFRYTQSMIKYDEVI